MNAIRDLFLRGKLLLGNSAQAALEAKTLLLKCTSLEENEFLSRPETPVSKREEACFFSLIERRRAGVPLSYLTGQREFWSMPFVVSPGVFIPRPETELIIEKVLELSSRRDETVVDVGTGCGNIAISIAGELPGAKVIATDISLKALKTARLNAERLKTPAVSFIRSNLFSALKSLDLAGKCDFIVSNPPYVSGDEWPELPPEVRDHEPRRALLAGASGLEFIRRLVRQSLPFLRTGGFLLFEIGQGQLEKSLSLLDSPWKNVLFFKDLGGIPRVIAAEKE